MPRRHRAQTNAINALRARWAVFLFCSLVVIALSFKVLTSIGYLSALDWLAFTLAVFLWQALIFYMDLDKNSAKNGNSLRLTFGFGTWLSILRLVLLSLLAGFLVLPRPLGWLAWAPFTLYLCFNLLDLFDGYVARRSGHVTRLGEKLDLDLDVRGMLLGSVLAVQFGTAAWWYLLVGMARHIYVAAIRLRQRLGLPVFEKPNRFSRPLAGLQMGVSTALLAPTLYAPYTILISTLVMAIFLSNFLMDWLTIGTRKPFVLNTSHDLIRLLPLGLRIAIFILAASQAVAGATFTLALVVAAFLLLGVGTRASALVMLVQIGLAVGSSGMDLVELVTVICSLGLVYLGPGSLFLWAPENILVRRRLGEQRVK